MANENKKAIRARVAALQNESDEALLELWHGQLTRTDMAAIVAHHEPTRCEAPRRTWARNG